MLYYNPYQIQIEEINFDLSLIDEHSNYFIEEADTNARSLLTIKVYENNKLVSKALLNLIGSINNLKASVLIDNGKIIVQSIQTIFCLDIKTLQLVWIFNDKENSFYELKLIDDFYYVFGFDCVVILDKKGNWIRSLIVEN